MARAIGKGQWLERPGTNMEPAAKELAEETLDDLKRQAIAETAWIPTLKRVAQRVPHAMKAFTEGP